MPQSHPSNGWAAYTRSGHRPVAHRVSAEDRLSKRLSLCAAAAVTVVSAAGFQAVSTKSPDRPRLDAPPGGTVPLPTETASQLPRIVTEPADTGSSRMPWWLGPLASLSASMPLAPLAGVPADQLRAVVKLLRVMSGEPADIALPTEIGGDGDSGPAAPNIGPAPDVTTLNLLLEMFRQRFPQLSSASMQPESFPDALVDVQRRVELNPAPPAVDPQISDLRPTTNAENADAPGATLVRRLVEKAVTTSVYPPTETSLATVAHGSSDTLTNAWVASTTTLSNGSQTRWGLSAARTQGGRVEVRSGSSSGVEASPAGNSPTEVKGSSGVDAGPEDAGSAGGGPADGDADSRTAG